jgi:hypothetical protein
LLPRWFLRSYENGGYTIVKAGFLLGLLFNPEDGTDKLLRNVVLRFD